MRAIAYMPRQVKLNRDWSEMTTEQAVEMLRKVQGEGGAVSRPVRPVEPAYVMTIDNLLKMLSILLRIKNDLPVIIMGETGCGKSSLIQQLTSILGLPLFTLNIHGGMEDSDVVGWMEDRISDADAFPTETMVCFLDEVHVVTAHTNPTNTQKVCGRIACWSVARAELRCASLQVNTCNSMGLFKEIVVDRSMNGFVLPRNLKVRRGWWRW